jgi:serine phosphatase RsbU (regulator of sigma subunit)
MATRKRQRDEDKSGDGLSIVARFTLSMTLALAIVSTLAGFFLYQSARRVSSSVQERTLIDTVQLTSDAAAQEIERQKLRGEREVYYKLEEQAIKDAAQTSRDFPPDPERPDYDSVRNAFQGYLIGVKQTYKTEREQRERTLKDLAQASLWRQTTEVADEFANGRVQRAKIEYGPERRSGVVYKYQGGEGKAPFFLLLPDSASQSERGLLGLIAGATFAIILVGAIVSVWVASQVSKPITQIVGIVRQISTGDLGHRTLARGGGEIGTLARAIERMTDSLAEARETEVELQVREREVEVAGEVREQLLPQTTPKVAGYELGALHVGSAQMGGDFHDFVEVGPGGREGVGLLVCEVSGKGLPGALVGATARSYLRARLAQGGDLQAAMQEINRQLARDVRRGMAVTSIYAVIDAAQGIATVACTGHKVPLIRYTGSDKKVRLIHPEGIALGFDKGPVFDGKLEIARVPIEPGDRLVLANSGAVSLVDAAGAEFGEKTLYGHIMRLGALPTEAFLERLRAAFEAHRGDAPLPRDVAVVTIARG